MAKSICLLAQLLGIAAATSNGCKAHEARSASLLQVHQSNEVSDTKLDEHPELIEKAKQKTSGHTKRLSGNWYDAPSCYALASVDSSGGYHANAPITSSASVFWPQNFGSVSNDDTIVDSADGVEYCAELCNMYSSTRSAGALYNQAMNCTGFQYSPDGHKCKFFNGDLAQMYWEDSTDNYVYIGTCTGSNTWTGYKVDDFTKIKSMKCKSYSETLSDNVGDGDYCKELCVKHALENLDTFGTSDFYCNYKKSDKTTCRIATTDDCTSNHKDDSRWNVFVFHGA